MFLSLQCILISQQGLFAYWNKKLLYLFNEVKEQKSLIILVIILIHFIFIFEIHWKWHDCDKNNEHAFKTSDERF